MRWNDIVPRGALAGDRIRLRLLAKGRVQGVGFRPSVYRFAREAGVDGFVRNTRLGVVIEIEGSPDAIDRFGGLLSDGLPPLARIDAMDWESVEPTGRTGFEILESEEPGGARALFPVDTAVCEDCLRELRDPADRRHRYPFITCTNCGPRFTIIESLPYDRRLTTMREFELCDYCASQYADPADRRFHAEPVCCPACGPRLRLLGASGAELPGDPAGEAVRMLGEGAIVAVKGIGGYHLACRADDPGAVERLRERKRRPAKPFAVMFRGIETLEAYCEIGGTERRLLLAFEAPIVLCRRGGRPLPEAVAPDNGYIGAFLPYTPLHHLILEPFEALIMTSANFTDEPLISTEEELRGVLGPVADAALVHDRRIAHKCDDSILFAPGGEAVPLRRARGYVPDPVPLREAGSEAVLALGAQEKGTFAFSRGGEAFVSPHLGDLGDFRSQANYRSELEAFERLLEVEPRVVVHDMHPDYFTTRLAAEIGAPVTVAVQHHHAHAVSVMVEHRLEEPVIAVSFDGTGYGSDGTLWGGEFLLARYRDFERLAHLRQVPLPGGEAAIREPWRMGLAHLRFLRDVAPGAGGIVERLFEGLPVAQVTRLVERGINAPSTSSIGRLFDAAAFMLGCGARVSFEAQSAIALEALALTGDPSAAGYRFGTAGEDPVVVDPAPVVDSLLADVAAGRRRGDIAAAFHAAVADMIVDLSTALARRRGCRSIVLSGGVFQNRLLCELLMGRRSVGQVDFHFHRIVPPNDGGVSLGQLQTGIARITGGRTAAGEGAT